MRRVVPVVTAVVCAVLGTRFTAPHDKAAGEPFAYAPPEGFSPSVDKESARDLANTSGDEREWVQAGRPGQDIVPRLHLKRSSARGTVESEDLEKIAKGMPSVLEESGVSWTDVRHETRVRADGSRVGLIEGECTKNVSEPGMTGEIKAKVRYRRLLFVFPTDDGSAFTTAIYGVTEAPKWQPVIESTITTARGVATRVPTPPGWMYVAWGGAGLVMGWLGVSLVRRRDRERERERGEGKPKGPPSLRPGGPAPEASGAAQDA